MSRKHFSILLIASLVIAATIALLVPGGVGEEPAKDDLFIEQLDQRINEVDSLVVTPGQAGQVIHLDRKEQAWVIRELEGYPADWTRLRELLANLAAARIIEKKTSNPVYFSRLGVEDIGIPGAKSRLLQVGLPGETLGVIIGNEESARGGQYVRIEGGAQSFLIDRQLDVGIRPMDWAQSEIIDIGSALVAELQIVHPDGEEVTLRKISADDSDFSLQGIPRGREIRSAWTVNSLANNFSMLRMEAVMPGSGVSIEDPVTIKLLSFSGLEIAADVFRHEENGWVRIRVKAPEINESLANEALAEEANMINRRVAGWLFQVPQSKFDSMTRRMEDLLEPADQEENS